MPWSTGTTKSSGDTYVRFVQLHSHLLFKVVVDQPNVPDDLVIRASSFTAFCCLVVDDPKTAEPLGRDLPSALRDLQLHFHPELRHIVRVDCQRHPLFKDMGRPTTEVQPRQWTPEDIDSQYSAYPKSCVEEKKSKKARRRGQKAWGSAIVTFRKSAAGEMDIHIQRPEKTIRYKPWKCRDTDEVNY